ncbi:hypothetical protein HZA99_00435 [Candidatus Woesearchaeota archaeon]|nr:hypothetical protein [Candidatus Woesearchaeota archaeon]
MNEQIIAQTILRKLMYLGKWGGSHTSVDNLPKGFPKHLRGDVKDIAKDLIKKNLLLAKPTSYGLEVSLNPEKKKEIETIVSSFKE